MALETRLIDSIVSSAGLSPSDAPTMLSNLRSDGFDWAIALDNNTDTSVHATFDNPSPNPTAGAGLQSISVNVKRTAGSGTLDPSCTIELWEAGGAAALTSTTATVTSNTTQTVTLSWDAALLALASGANVEVKVLGVKTGGSPAKRSAVDIDYIIWNVDYSAADIVTIVNATTSTLNLTKTNPSVIVEFDIDIDVLATASVLNLSAQPAIVSVISDIDVQVTASVSALLLTASNATIDTNIDTDALATVSTLNLTSTKSIVSVSRDVVVTASSASLLLTVNNAIIVVGTSDTNVVVIASESSVLMLTTPAIAYVDNDVDVIASTVTISIIALSASVFPMGQGKSENAKGRKMVQIVVQPMTSAIVRAV